MKVPQKSREVGNSGSPDRAVINYRGKGFTTRRGSKKAREGVGKMIEHVELFEEGGTHKASNPEPGLRNQCLCGRHRLSSGERTGKINQECNNVNRRWVKRGLSIFRWKMVNIIYIHTGHFESESRCLVELYFSAWLLLWPWSVPRSERARIFPCVAIQLRRRTEAKRTRVPSRTWWYDRAGYAPKLAP